MESSARKSCCILNHYIETSLVQHQVENGTRADTERLHHRNRSTVGWRLTHSGLCVCVNWFLPFIRWSFLLFSSLLYLSQLLAFDIGWIKFLNYCFLKNKRIFRKDLILTDIWLLGNEETSVKMIHIKLLIIWYVCISNSIIMQCQVSMLLRIIFRTQT